MDMNFQFLVMCSSRNFTIFKKKKFHCHSWFCFPMIAKDSGSNPVFYAVISVSLGCCSCFPVRVVLLFNFVNSCASLYSWSVKLRIKVSSQKRICFLSVSRNTFLYILFPSNVHRLIHISAFDFRLPSFCIFSFRTKYKFCHVLSVVAISSYR